ncbi:type IX secretion system ring protein PorN/GldN [Rhodoflexus sp.]
MKKLLCVFVLATVAIVQAANAQEYEEWGYNKNSLRPIKNTDQLFKKSLWYTIDLREKQNKPFNAKGYEITGLLIEAVQSGILRPFTDETLSERLSLEEFTKRLTKQAPAYDPDDLVFEDDGWGGEPGSDGTASTEPEMYLPGKELYLLEIKEDLIFDKKRSRMYRDIQTITIILPAEVNTSGVDKPIATFLYKEVVENVFRDNNKAVWFNNANPREHRNMAEAFDLRLFSAHLTKYENGDGATIADIYGEGARAMYASLQIEYALLEFESNLWEN